MNYFFAGLILALWYTIIVASAWDKKIKTSHNIIISLMELLFLGAIYWVPFWLIFLR